MERDTLSDRPRRHIEDDRRWVGIIATHNLEAQLGYANSRLKVGRGVAGNCCSCVSLQLIFRNGPVEGLEAAFYPVLELSISFRELSKYFILTRRSVPQTNARIEAHHVPGAEAMPGRYVFVQLSHGGGAFSCATQIAEAMRCTPALRPPPSRFPRSES